MSAEDEWSCALHGRILSFRQDPDYLHYRAIFPPSSHAHDNDDTLALVKHYFNLRLNLTHLYNQWATADPNFKKRAPKFTGVRILRQDPWEALIGFICSSNNNISRISTMVANLCLHYGPLIGHIDGVPYHDFPTPETLAKPEIEGELMKLGFGYRAKYIYRTAVMVAEKRDGLKWLDGLCNPESPALGYPLGEAGELVEGGREGYRKAHEELLALHGVGPKVADCVCLMGLGWSESVPVDTHVWQIAQRDYKFGKGKHSSLTPATYTAVANHFRKLWGKEAGWAHSVLFTADLKAFSERLVMKTEVKEEKTKVKVEDDFVVKEEEEKTQTITKFSVKRPAPEPEPGRRVIKVEEKTTLRRSKRRKT